MIAARYLPAVCVLVALALVPTLIHSYSPDVAVDGRGTEAIPVSLAGYTGVASSRDAAWGQRRFGSDDWIERDYRSGTDEVRLTVVRSFDPKTLYHHPELAIAYSTSFVGEEIKRMPAEPAIPVHRLKPNAGVEALGMYVLHYDDQFVENPMLFQIQTAGELLFSGRKPMTIFFALDPRAPEDGNIETSGASRVLFAAIASFLAPDKDPATAER